MTRPHPVVGLSAELADRCRRSAHEADVTVGPVDEKVLDIIIVEILDFDTAAGIVGLGGFDQGRGSLLAVGLSGDIGHAHQESDGQTRGRNLFLVAHCPETVLEIVVLIAREPLDVAVATMVVGHK